MLRTYLINKLITVTTKHYVRVNLVPIVELVEWTNIDELVSDWNYNIILSCSVKRMINESVVCAAIPVAVISNVKEMPVPINWIRTRLWKRIENWFVISPALRILTKTIIIPPVQVFDTIWLSVPLSLRVVEGIVWRQEWFSVSCYITSDIRISWSNTTTVRSVNCTPVIISCTWRPLWRRGTTLGM